MRSHLRLLKVLRDEPLIEKARLVGTKLIEADPTLAALPELAAAVKELAADEASTFVDKG